MSPNVAWSAITTNGAGVGFGNGAGSGFGNGANAGFGNGASASFGNGAGTTFGNGASVTFPNGAAVAFPNGANVGFGNGANAGFGNGASIGLGNGAAIGFPNGAAVSYPNGAAINSNGAMTTLGNGASTTYPNGAYVSYPNGAYVSFPNGASAYYNGATTNFGNGASTTYPNGASVWFPNGASVSYPNGATTTYNGASVNFGNGAPTTFGNGASIMFPNGANVSFPNGASVLYNGATTNFGNGASTTYPNGASVTFPNGAYVTFPNGAAVMYNGASATFGNGASITYPNGASVTYPNGASVSYPNGAAVTYNGATTNFGNGASTTYPNGASVTFPNGATVSYPNGAATTYNGATVSYGNGASVTYPNGASATYPNGATITFPNGAMVTFPNGAIVTMPNGAVVNLPNGATVTFPNGASVTFPNGAGVQWNGYSTQAFLTSNLFRYKSLQTSILTPTNFATTHDKLYNYLVAAFQLMNGHLSSWTPDGISVFPDPYDMIAFKYLIQSAAQTGTNFTISYVYNSATYTHTFMGGLGLCESITGYGPVSSFFNGTLDHDYRCSQWVTAAIAVWTQPSGINNMVSVTNVTSTDPGIPAGTILTNPSPALALASIINPMPRKRGQPYDPTQLNDVRELESMTTLGANQAYNALNPTQGGWQGLYAFRCQGGSQVVFNLNGLKAAYPTANPVLRISRGVHGSNRLGPDWVGDYDDTGADLYPTASFTCGGDRTEIATANLSKYNFVYNAMVRSFNGVDSTTTSLASACLALPTRCGSGTNTPNTAPAGEAQIFTLHESYNAGNSFFSLTNGIDPSGEGNGWTNVRDNSANLLLAESCDVRSVNPASASTETWTPPEFGSNFSSWHFTPATFTTYTHQTVPSDRAVYQREFCSSTRTDKCIPCTGNGWMPDLRVDPNGRGFPFKTYKPSITTVRIAGRQDPPQYPNEKPYVDQAYYNKTRVCAQRNDYTGQGYCFSDFYCMSESTCPASRTLNPVYQSGPAVVETAGSYFALKVSLPQDVQPISTLDANACPVGSTKHPQNGRCFELYANGTACTAAVQCASNNCASGTCAALAAPTGLTLTAQSGQVYVNWNTVPGAQSYNLYRVGYGLVTNTGSSAYTNTGLTNGTSYTWYVAAVSPNNQIGASSTQVSVAPTATGTNKAVAGQTVWISSAVLPNAGSNAFDGNTAALWASNSSTYWQSLTQAQSKIRLDLGAGYESSVHSVNQINLSARCSAAATIWIQTGNTLDASGQLIVTASRGYSCTTTQQTFTGATWNVLGARYVQITNDTAAVGMYVHGLAVWANN